MLVDKDLNCVNGCGVLTANHYEGVPVHLCHQCKGIWLSFASLKEIINTQDRVWTEQERDADLQEFGKAGVPEAELQRHLNCPECESAMPAMNYQYSSGIIINKCSQHHGVWLDCGELTKIQIYKEASKQRHT